MNTHTKIIAASLMGIATIGTSVALVNWADSIEPVESFPADQLSLGVVNPKWIGIRRVVAHSPKVYHLPSITVTNLNWSNSKIQPGIHGLMRFGPVRVEQNIVSNIVKAANSSKINPALLMAIADKESNFKTKVKAKTSSATGLFQFIEKTWFKAMKTYGSRYGYTQEAAAISNDEVSTQKKTQILKLRTNPFLSAALAGEMLKNEGRELSYKIGRPLTAGETYLIHFLGPDDAEKFLKTVVTTPFVSAASLLPKPAQANRPIFYAKQGTPRTVAEVRDSFESMMGSRFKRYQNVAGKLPKGAMAYTD